MKVLYDHQAFAIQRFGGVSRYFYELACRAHAAAGVEAEILAPLYTCGYFTAASALRPRGFRVPDRRSTRVFLQALNPAVSWLLSRPRRDVDVFHETYYSRFDTKPASAARVLTVFDMIHERFPDEFSDAAEMSRRKLRAIHRADHLICISQATRDDLLEMTSIDPARVSVVHLGQALPALAQPAPGLAQPAIRPYFLYVGMRRGYKNFDALLRALSSSRRLGKEYSVLCFGGPPLSASERERISVLGLRPDAVLQVGGADECLAAYYAGATALVYPSLYEGFGIPPLEAMALGCPVICSDCGAIREVVGDAAELFDPTDAEALRAAMERVAEGTVHTSGMVARGRLRAAGFSWDRCAEETIAVYHRLITG